MDYSYNGILGQWWLERAADGTHQRAYRNIAGFIRDSVSCSPRLIVDYACGAGDLLSLLSRHFPQSRLVGLDGSSFLLYRALKKVSRLPRSCAARISLIETALPLNRAVCERADLVVYCFPNMTLSGVAEKIKDARFGLSERDRRVAESLSNAKDPGDDDPEILDPQGAQHTLEYGRSISKNLRRLLVRGGICVRAEYATTRRHEWSPLELAQVSFEEGSLDVPVDGIKPGVWFQVLASAYFQSRVLEDVFEQTGDERDRSGGYLITVLRAI